MTTTRPERLRMGTADHAPSPAPRLVADPDLPVRERTYLAGLVAEPGIMRMIRDDAMETWAVRRLGIHGPVAAVGVVLLALAVPAGSVLEQVLFTVGLVLLVAAAVGVWRAVRTQRDWQATAELVRSSRDRVVTAEDLDGHGREMLARTQRAIDAVLSSRVHRDGVLDRIHNEVLLPETEWQIARRLRELTHLRAQHAGRSGADEALDQVDQDVTRHVAMLEAYAVRVAAADVEYRTAGDSHTLDELENLVLLAESLALGPAGDAKPKRVGPGSP
jgi:hypothetical protein